MDCLTLVIKKYSTVFNWWITAYKGSFLRFLERWLLQRVQSKEEKEVEEEEKWGKEGKGEVVGLELSTNSFYCSLISWPRNPPPP